MPVENYFSFEAQENVSGSRFLRRQRFSYAFNRLKLRLYYLINMLNYQKIYNFTFNNNLNTVWFNVGMCITFVTSTPRFSLIRDFVMASKGWWQKFRCTVAILVNSTHVNRTSNHWSLMAFRLTNTHLEFKDYAGTKFTMYFFFQCFQSPFSICNSFVYCFKTI